jgi:pyridinium-3,5-bisthiocarboxylic acid mononucleotide nickel chelatase
MRVLYFDAFAGISGDMTVGALVSLGVAPDLIERELAGLPVRGFEVRFSDREVHGIRAVKFDVSLRKRALKDRAGEHRLFRDIRASIEGSKLRLPCKEKALAIFTRLAEAEARVHGVAVDAVEFHEVGAVDSIVDIVATAIGMVEIGAERVCVSTLPLGCGTVKSRHGPMPVPAPATVELLKGYPVRIGDGEGELVTPTGAAIVSTFAKPGQVLPPLRVEAVGYGAGTRTLTDRPNVLRLLVGTADVACGADEMVVLETNIDDTSPELYDYVMEQLFAAGARDVSLAPLQMKKNRPGTLLRVIADPASYNILAGIILRETSAIGVRWFPVRRIVLPREKIEVDTEFGTVQVKISRAPDGTVNIAPEYDGCRRLASERRVPLKIVYQAAIAAARQTPATLTGSSRQERSGMSAARGGTRKNRAGRE